MPPMYSNATKMWKTGDCVVFLQSTTNLKSLHEFGFSTLIWSEKQNKENELLRDF